MLSDNKEDATEEGARLFATEQSARLFATEQIRHSGFKGLELVAYAVLRLVGTLASILRALIDLRAVMAADLSDAVRPAPAEGESHGGADETI